MPNGNTHAWYAAFKAKDARFDGRFFIGVSSTGIYCRPVCKAKLPKAENCTYYDSAAAAEHAGFRPCLLCRPELAPGNAPVDATLSLVHRAARLLEENCGSGQNLDEFVQKLGCSDRHLRRAFTAEYNVSPVQYLQTCRLLLAKNLLTDTDLSVTDVAMAAGFGSLRRFNDLFKKQYRLVPTALRRQAAVAKGSRTNVTLILGYRPPYQWRQMLNFLSQRVIPNVERVSNDEYARTVHFVSAEQKDVFGWVRVGHLPQKNALAVTVDSTLLPVLPQVLSRIRHLFDLYCDPAIIYETLAVMNTIRPGLCVAGTRLPGCIEPFEMVVRAVLGQQITVKAACTLAGRLVASLGKPVTTGIEGLVYVFPSPADIVALQGPIADYFGPLGITASRAKTILELAKVFVTGRIDFRLCTQPELEMQKLMSISGIGTWTAQYIAMRAMGWPDAFPHTDSGVKKALSPLSKNGILQLAEAWRPWRSYATINLWNFLGLQKN
ncbi:MAG: helix-turn-helix domain-containing protein [Deltaproteobacteria bacterium]|jgi:AraC family transcriptional regulator of adaptative response / DNA-3-methyladenine glycosylase II|nr:helix-turn-helix domain-containing protein [Deltaproteobacteria bacterium]